MYEVEVKVAAPHGPVRRRLEELGADPIDTVRQVDTYFDAPTRDFAETDEALRLRREGAQVAEGGPDDHIDRDGDDAGGERALLTYKGPKVDRDSKTRLEHETGVEDAAAMREILEGVGCAAAAGVEKVRERYRLDGCTVSLDRVASLGEFVEIETSAPSAEAVAARRDEAIEVLERLGLDPAEQIRRSYLALLLEDDDG